MPFPGRAKPVVLLLGLVLAGCVSSQGPAPAPTPAPASPLACDGQPNWCAILANEVNVTSALYIDGQPVAVAGPEQSVRVAVPAGETHFINYCRYGTSRSYGGLVANDWKSCRIPERFTFDQNKVLIVIDNKESMY